VELRALSLKPHRFRRIGMLLQREGAQKPSVKAWLDLSGSHWIVGATVGCCCKIAISPTIMPGMLPDRRARHFFYFF